MAADLSNPVDLAEISKSHALSNELPPYEKHQPLEKELGAVNQSELSTGDAGVATVDGAYPTVEEFGTLRRVPGSLNWPAYTVAFVELCERFSYYGTTQVCTYLYPFVFMSIGTDHQQLSTSSSVHVRRIRPPELATIEMFLEPWEWGNAHPPG